jgi:hypothetical protein
MQPIKLVLVVMAYLFHQLRPTQVQGNTKLTLQASLRIQCSKLWVRKAPLISAPHLATRPFSHKPIKHQTASSAMQTVTKVVSSTRILQDSSTSTILSTIRDPIATSINNKAGGTYPPPLMMPPSLSCTTNLMVNYNHHKLKFRGTLESQDEETCVGRANPHG